MMQYVCVLRFKGIQAVRIDFFFILKVANIRCFILIAVEIFIISYVNSLEQGNTLLFYFLESSKESNVYPCNIHMT